MTKAILQAENLAYERHDQFLFSKLNFQLHAGQALQVEGINGAGKTTLLRVLTGLIQPHDGHILWRDKNIQECREEYYAQLLYIGHLAAIKAQLTPYENLQATTALHGNTNKDIEAALAKVNLQNYLHIPCQQLSAGQQRRVTLAKLWLCHAKLWILDEPFVALDKKGIENINTIITQHLSDGGIAVLTSHQPLALQNCSLRRLLLD